MFNAVNTLECVTAIFDQAHCLDKLEGFTSLNGAAWYGLPVNTQTITLEKRDDTLPLSEPISVGGDIVTPFDPAQPVFWHVVQERTETHATAPTHGPDS